MIFRRFSLVPRAAKTRKQNLKKESLDPQRASWLLRGAVASVLALASADRPKRRSSANLASAGRRHRRSEAIETSIHPKQYKTSASSTKSKCIETFGYMETIQNFCKCIATAFPANVAATESFQNCCKCSDIAFPT